MRGVVCSAALLVALLGAVASGADCPAGTIGENCDQECEDGFFGQGCVTECDCGGAGLCDKVTGKCSCPPGKTFAVFKLIDNCVDYNFIKFLF
jgi:hypothetical protein